MHRSHLAKSLEGTLVTFGIKDQHFKVSAVPKYKFKCDLN